MKPEQQVKLREPFPPELIGKLPRRGTDGIDYVGHAAVTERLLEVDPEWTWKPLAQDEHGNPMLFRIADEFGLWIELTVAGVTRPEYGQGRDPKVAVSDAIKRAAMRFGVALDLWSKEELHGSGREQPPSGGQGENPSPADATMEASQEAPRSRPEEPFIPPAAKPAVKKKITAKADALYKAGVLFAEQYKSILDVIDDLDAVKAEKWLERLGRLEHEAAEAA